MNPVERSAHPSTAQIHYLLNFLEKNPSLAKGFPKVPSARDRVRKSWEKLALELNSLRGSVKTWKQWTKYWADKKSAVKKKGALRSQNRNKTGALNEVVELSEIEERILTIMGFESFATGDAQAGQNSQDSPSLLASTSLKGLNPVPLLPMEQQSTPSLIGDVKVPVVETKQQHVTERQAILCQEMPETCGPSSRPRVLMVSLSPLSMVPSPPCTPPTVGGPASPPVSPSRSDSHPQDPLRNARRQLIGSPVHNNTLPNTTTSRLRHIRRSRVSPPSLLHPQRRSQFTRVLERILALEEKKIEINRRNSENFERLVNSIGEGFELLAETLKNKKI